MYEAADRHQSGAQDESGPPPRYVVDLSKKKTSTRSVPHLISRRRCYACRQADDDPSPKSNPRRFIRTIVDHCCQTPDYLLGDTPLKEAIFRVILAGGNRETTPEEISEALSKQWSNTAYPRDTSPNMIRALIVRSESYCIVRVAEAEAEAEEGEVSAD